MTRNIQSKRGQKRVNVQDSAPIAKGEIGEIGRQVAEAYRRKFGPSGWGRRFVERGGR